MPKDLNDANTQPLCQRHGKPVMKNDKRRCALCKMEDEGR